jgi:hypothetical protein
MKWVVHMTESVKVKRMRNPYKNHHHNVDHHNSMAGGCQQFFPWKLGIKLKKLHSRIRIPPTLCLHAVFFRNYPSAGARDELILSTVFRQT